jgi:hypothetical protein
VVSRQVRRCSKKKQELLRVAESSPTGSLDATLEVLKPGDHACAIYNNDLEHLELIVPFICIGLKGGEKCVYIAEEGDERYVDTFSPRPH